MNDRNPMAFEPGDLARVLGPGLAQRWYPHLLETFRTFGIDTARRQAHFLAQADVESGGFTRLEENLNYSAEGLLRVWPSRFTPALAQQMAHRPEMIANYVYGGRYGNGPASSGDGWRYRGRGLKQITFKANYQNLTVGLRKALPQESVPDFVKDPDLLLQDRWAALSAGWFWSSRFSFDRARPVWGLNYYADRGDVVRISRLINGGDNGLPERIRRTERWLWALGVDR